MTLKKDKIKIIYEDRDIIVVNKSANLLTISTNNEKEKTLFLYPYLLLFFISIIY